MLVTSSDLRAREVINVVDGRRLGVLSDVEFDPETGQIQALIFGEPGRHLFRHNDEEIKIPWSQVVLVGVDCLLVEAPQLAENPYVVAYRRGRANGPGTISGTPSFSTPHP